jgi:hypothetical protein
MVFATDKKQNLLKDFIQDKSIAVCVQSISLQIKHFVSAAIESIVQRKEADGDKLPLK